MLADYALPILVILLIVITASGLPFSISMIVASIFYLLVSGRDVGLAAENVLNGVFGNFVALAVPLFIFAANIMESGKITERLLKFSLAMVGRLPGGLAQVNVITSLIFSGMSGSAISDAAGVGKVVTGMMIEKDRYPRGFAGALTAATAVVGPIFPPSIPLVFYALISSTSVGVLFLAGVVPALIVVLVQCVFVQVVAIKRKFPVEAAIPWGLYPVIILRAVPPLMMPVVLLGGIYSGAFTPTEAAAVSAFYALVLAVLAYRSLTWGEFYAVVRETVKTTAVVTLVLGGAFVFNYAITIERVPQMLYEFLVSFEMNQWTFLLLVNILYLLLGCFLDVSTIMLVITPLFIPTAAALGIDLHHFGVVVVFNMMIGLITPPYGILLYIIKAINGIPLGEMIREVWVHIALLVGILMLITYVPELVLWLPRFAGLLN